MCLEALDVWPFGTLFYRMSRVMFSLCLSDQYFGALFINKQMFSLYFYFVLLPFFLALLITNIVSGTVCNVAT